MNTEKMPRLPGVNYSDVYIIKEAFVNDLQKKIDESEEEGYSMDSAKVIIDDIKKCGNEMTIARINELTARITHEPFRYIANIVYTIQNNQDLYFVKKD